MKKEENSSPDESGLVVDSGVGIVWTTVGDSDDANELAERIVGDRLAACVQIDAPITSVYRWDGRIETATEIRLMIKTTWSRVPALVAWLGENHPYDVPQVVAVRASIASEGYAAWVTESIRRRTD